MAKTFKPKTAGITVDNELIEDVVEDAVENSVETVENINLGEEPVNEPDLDITINSAIEQKPPVKNVKICPNSNHTCSIGGVRYYLKKDVQTNVPVEVKEILNKSGLLKPL